MKVIYRIRLVELQPLSLFADDIEEFDLSDYSHIYITPFIFFNHILCIDYTTTVIQQTIIIILRLFSLVSQSDTIEYSVNVIK